MVLDEGPFLYVLLSRDSILLVHISKKDGYIRGKHHYLHWGAVINSRWIHFTRGDVG